MNLDGGEIRYNANIIVTSNTIALMPIIDALRLTPKIAWSTGDKISDSINAGGRRQFNYCLFNITAGSWRDIEYDLEKYLHQLRPHKDYIDKVQLDGGAVLLVVNWYAGHSRAYEFGFDFLEQLADLHIDLGIDIPDDDISV